MSQKTNVQYSSKEICYNMQYSLQPSTIVYVPNANDNYVPARASGNVQTSGAGSAASTMNQQETGKFPFRTF